MENTSRKYGLDTITFMHQLGYRPENCSTMFEYPLPEMKPTIAPTNASADGTTPVAVSLLSSKASECLDSVVSFISYCFIQGFPHDVIFQKGNDLPKNTSVSETTEVSI